MMTPSSRRLFLKTTAATAVSYSRIRGANDRIRLAGLGCGGRTRYLLSLAAQQGAEVVAACDVYEPRIDLVREKINPQAAAYVDYRQVLERTDIDAVIIGSPDHWHVPMTIDAIRAGKDVYVEKPVSHNIEEGRRLLEVAKASRQLVQVGYQQRSWEHFQRAREIIVSGKLGKITLILASWYQAYAEFDPATPFEANKIDWKRFLGSAPEQPLSPVRYFRWRWFWDFGGGHLTDLYSHWCDVIHWFMNEDRPTEVQSMGASYAWKFAECPDTISTMWDYGGRFAVAYNGTLHCHLEGGTLIFRGDKAMLRITRDGFAVYPEGVIPREKTQYPEPEIQMRSLEDGTVAHVRNFLESIRSRRPPNAPLEAAVGAADAAHFGNLALRRGKRLRREEV